MADEEEVAWGEMASERVPSAQTLAIRPGDIPWRKRRAQQVVARDRETSEDVHRGDVVARTRDDVGGFTYLGGDR